MIDSLQDSLDEAFDRFGDFIAVQGRHPSVEALALVQEALGLDGESRWLMIERLQSDFTEDFEAPQVLLGVILGVSAAGLAQERDGSG
jgi:hypothetical protein